ADRPRIEIAEAPSGRSLIACTRGAECARQSLSRRAGAIEPRWLPDEHPVRERAKPPGVNRSGGRRRPVEDLGGAVLVRPDTTRHVVVLDGSSETEVEQ